LDYTLPQFKIVIDSFAAAGGNRNIPIAIFGVKAIADPGVLK
jgi:hypothetical protein